VFGTPIRKTNQAGAGTKGTSLVDGIGPVGMVFDFDPAPGVALRVPFSELEAALAARTALEHAQANYTRTLEQLAARL